MTDSFKIVAGVDFLIIAGCILSGNMHWLLNTQVGYISAALVVYGSFWGYKRMIDARISAGDNSFQRDYLDKIEDPYDLDEEEQSPKDLEKDFKEIVKEEKEALKKKKRSVFQVIKDSRASLSIYRLVSYLILFLAFMVLNTKGLLHIQSYLFGVVLAPLVVIAASYAAKAKEG